MPIRYEDDPGVYLSMYLVKHKNITAALFTPEQVFEHVLEALKREEPDMPERDVYNSAVGARIFAETAEKGKVFGVKNLKVEIR